MILKTDDRCRLASRVHFKPNRAYEAAIDEKGVITLVELVPKTRGKTKLVKEGDLLVVDTEREVDLGELDRELEDYL